MFHRRLLLLLGGIILTYAVLSAQLLRLSVVEGGEHRDEAEQNLDIYTYLPTVRGSILDRNGVELAVDRPSYDVAVHYRLVTGSWQMSRAAREARRHVGASAWEELSDDERNLEVERARLVFEQQAEAAWESIRRWGDLTAEELDERRDGIRRHVSALAAAVWQRQERIWLEDRKARREETRFTFDDRRPFTPRPILEQTQAHVILTGVDTQTVQEVEQFARQMDDRVRLLEIRDSTRRAYPNLVWDVTLDRSSLPAPIRTDEPLTVRVAGVADHYLGSMRYKIWQSDVERRPFVHPETGEVDRGAYLPTGDRIGNSGLELVYETELRGNRGQRVKHLATGEDEVEEAERGIDLRLTLDVMLQARVQAVLSSELGLTTVQPWHGHPVYDVGAPLNAAAVVLEVHSGDILAMVSVPTLAMGLTMSDADATETMPFLNRSIQAIYPPGSIIKPLVLCAAVEEGVHRLGEEITCGGHFYPDNQHRWRCWYYREKYGFGTHGPLAATEAIGRSCNIFFYTLADELGGPRLSRWLRGFGAGRPALGLTTPLIGDRGQLVYDEDGEPVMTLAGEVRGQIPGEERSSSLHASDIIAMGIGQGPVTWTPLQAAQAYATLARRGTFRGARLVANDPRAETRTPLPDLRISDDVYDTALAGLRFSVENLYGTGNHITLERADGTKHRDAIFNRTGVTVWGKTGTAQAPIQKIDADGDGEPENIRLDHAWFVGLVGPENGPPLYSIAVIVEHAGSGGRVSGPVANQIIHALQTEHYLPGS